MEDSVGKGVIKFRESASIVDTKMLNLSKVVIAEHLEQSYKNEQKRQQVLLEEINETEENILKLSTERSKIIKSLDIIRKNKLTDFFKNLIPNANKIDSLDLAIPEKAALIESLEIIKKGIDGITSGLKYIDLDDARQKISEEINRINNELKNMNVRLEQVTLLLSDISNIFRLEVERGVILLEVKKLKEAFIDFSSALDILKNSTIELTIDNLKKIIEGKKYFLQDFIQQYNA